MNDFTASFPVDSESIKNMPLVNRSATFSPLTISGDGWSLDFQSRPEPKVIRRGRVPTVEEVVFSLALTQLPAIFALIIPIIAASVPEAE